MTNAVTTLHQNAPVELSPRQLATVKQTIAADCNEPEFNLLVEFARFKRLSLITKQVIPIVFNKRDADKRKMSIVVTQDGLRALASRTHDYRPAETEPTFTFDDAIKSQTNLLGLLKCTTTLWKQDPHSHSWHPVNGWAFWDEMAPVADEWAYDETKGKRAPTGKKIIEGNWAKMPRIMLAKCSTMQALRAGWPDTYDGIYAQEEFDRERFLDLTATEIVEKEQSERREKAIAMSTGEVPWIDYDGNLAFIPSGRFSDHVLSMLRNFTKRSELDEMTTRNREAFKRFWARSADEALMLKKEIETTAAKFPKEIQRS